MTRASNVERRTIAKVIPEEVIPPEEQSATAALLAEIVRRIRAVSDPEQIILFGSYARGDFGSDSDLDLLVITGEVDSTRAEAARISPEILAFHVRQAAEKALKALLVQRQVEFPRTHAKVSSRKRRDHTIRRGHRRCRTRPR